MARLWISERYRKCRNGSGGRARQSGLVFAKGGLSRTWSHDGAVCAHPTARSGHNRAAAGGHCRSVGRKPHPVVNTAVLAWCLSENGRFRPDSLIERFTPGGQSARRSDRAPCRGTLFPEYRAMPTLRDGKHRCRKDGARRWKCSADRIPDQPTDITADWQHVFLAFADPVFQKAGLVFRQIWSDLAFHVSPVCLTSWLTSVNLNHPPRLFLAVLTTNLQFYYSGNEMNCKFVRHVRRIEVSFNPPLSYYCLDCPRPIFLASSDLCFA